MKATKLLPYTVTIAAVVASLSPAHAEDWKAIGQFGWFGVGKAYQIEKGHVYWVGEFTGTFFNDKGKDGLFDRDGVKCPAYFDFDINNSRQNANFDELRQLLCKGKCGGSRNRSVIIMVDNHVPYVTWRFPDCDRKLCWRTVH